MNVTLSSVLSWVWEFLKIAVFPICLWLFEKKINQREKNLDEQAKIQYLLMQRIDKLSEMTHLMAVRLHEKKIINGDLEALDKKYKELDEAYEEEVKRLALVVYSKR